ncbi:hypothetical protein FQN54_007640 [Arachnomyces sp. PD_36]|nr:hypothetical protein FQN54_007640 [Arachnomyces sp. PD_36]
MSRARQAQDLPHERQTIMEAVYAVWPDLIGRPSGLRNKSPATMVLAEWKNVRINKRLRTLRDTFVRHSLSK